MSFLILILCSISGVSGNLIAAELYSQHYVKRMIILINFLIIAVFSFVYFAFDNMLHFALILFIKMCYQISLITLYLLIISLYTNDLRIEAYNLNHGFSMLISISFPFIQFYSFKFGSNGPFLLTAIIFLCTAFAVFLI